MKPAPSDRAVVDLLKEKIAELIQKNPAKAAMILTDWLTHLPKKFLKKAG